MSSSDKPTLVLGASANPERYSYRAVISLQRKDIPVIAIGRKEDEICGLRIFRKLPENVKRIHTIALYLNAANQREYYDLILSLKPERIIFNPGTYNPELEVLATDSGIEVVDGCMLVMLITGEF